MLTRELPVEHLSNKELGRGIIVGSELIPSVDKEQLNHTVVMGVIWENLTTPCPSYHSPEELSCTLDFDDEFETDEEETEEEAEEEAEDETIIEDNNFPEGELLVDDNDLTSEEPTE